MRHLVDAKTKEFFHVDDSYNLWSCDCLLLVDERVSLCLSQCVCLQEEGKLRELKREVAQKRKELGLLMN